jgi:hypothetical protein
MQGQQSLDLLDWIENRTAGSKQAVINTLLPIFPPKPKRQKPVKELDLLNKPF